MKIIEAMKRLKENEAKIADLCNKVKQHSAHLSFESPLYGTDQQSTVDGWVQASHDLVQDNIGLLVAIAKTNQLTQVTIELGGKTVTKSIAEWVWRRRKYAAIDLSIAQSLTDRGLKEGALPVTTGGEPQKVTIVRYYDPKKRDEAVGMYQAEAGRIDAALEIVNAVTDLAE